MGESPNILDIKYALSLRAEGWGDNEVLIIITIEMKNMMKST